MLTGTAHQNSFCEVMPLYPSALPGTAVPEQYLYIWKCCSYLRTFYSEFINNATRMIHMQCYFSFALMYWGGYINQKTAHKSATVNEL